MVEQEPDDLADLGLGLDRDRIRAHDPGDRGRQLLPEGVGTPDLQQAGDVDPGEIAVAEHADQDTPQGDRDVANVHLAHQVPHFCDAGLGCHGQGIGGHHVTSDHEGLLGVSISREQARCQCRSPLDFDTYLRAE